MTCHNCRCLKILQFNGEVTFECLLNETINSMYEYIGKKVLLRCEPSTSCLKPMTEEEEKRAYVIKGLDGL